MSRIHLDTALSQLDGTLALLEDTIPAALAEAPDLRARLEPATRAAQAAVVRSPGLARRAGGVTRGRPARIGEGLFAAQLALTLDTEFAPADLLARALADLEESTQMIIDEAGRYADVRTPDASTVRSVLDELSADAPTNATILGLCRDAMADATRFVRERDLVTVYDDPVVVVEMPEIDRGCIRGLLPSGRAVGAGRAAHGIRRLPHPVRLDAGTGSVALPRIQRAHAAEPRGARGRCRGTPFSSCTPTGTARARRCARSGGADRSSRDGPSTPRS